MSGLICKFKLPTPCQCGLAAGVYNSPQILVFCRRIWTRQREQTNLRHHVQDHRDHAAAHRSGQQLVWQHRYIQGSLALNLLCMDVYVAVLLINGTITNWLSLNVNYCAPLCLPVSLRGNVIRGWWIMCYGSYKWFLTCLLFFFTEGRVCCSVWCDQTGYSQMQMHP